MPFGSRGCAIPPNPTVQIVLYYADKKFSLMDEYMTDQCNTKENSERLCLAG